MTEQKKYLPKWAEAEFSQLRAKVEALEADNSKLRGEFTGEPWGWVPGADHRASTEIPVLASQFGKLYRKVEIGELDDSNRWEVQLNPDNSISVRSPYFSNGRMVIVPNVSNSIDIRMVEGL